MCDMHAVVNVYDFMSDVYIGARVYDLDERAGASRLVHETVLLIPGAGVDQGRKWLRDALVELVETL